jgi:hypothetical protein
MNEQNTYLSSGGEEKRFKPLQIRRMPRKAFQSLDIVQSLSLQGMPRSQISVA